jgi:hypothetical protein
MAFPTQKFLNLNTSTFFRLNGHKQELIQVTVNPAVCKHNSFHLFSVWMPTDILRFLTPRRLFGNFPFSTFFVIMQRYSLYTSQLAFEKAVFN